MISTVKRSSGRLNPFIAKIKKKNDNGQKITYNTNLQTLQYHRLMTRLVNIGYYLLLTNDLQYEYWLLLNNDVNG